MTSFIFSKRQLATFLVSVVLSIFLVALTAFGITYIDTDSVGVATSSPGGALGVKGAAFIDGFVLADYVVATSSGSIFQWENGSATSTTYAVGVGGFGSVKGNWNVDATSSVSSLIATNTLSVGSSSPTFQFAVVGRANFGSGDVSISGGLLDVQSTATSTFDGGISVPTTGGLSTASGLTVTGGDIQSSGKLTVTSAATSSFSGTILASGLLNATNLYSSNAATSAFEGGIRIKTTGGLESGAGLTVTAGDIQSSGKITVTSAATSSITGSFTVDTNSLNVDSGGNGVGIATSTYPSITGDVAATVSVGAGSASSTLYLAGGDSVGSSIILKSTDGTGCISIMATRGSAAIDAAITLSATVVDCPAP